MSALSAVLIGLLFGIPLAGAENETPAVRIEVQIGVGEYSTGLSGVTLRVDSANAVNLRIRVFEPSGSKAPTDVDDPSTLLEIRDEGDPGAGTRFADWRHVDTGVYEVEDVIDKPGNYLVLLLPDVEDRSLLPESSTDHLTLTVESATPAAFSGGTSTGLWVSLGLVILVLVLVVLGTRGRRRVPKEPVPHDTWWNSP